MGGERWVCGLSFQSVNKKPYNILATFDLGVGKVTHKDLFLSAEKNFKKIKAEWIKTAETFLPDFDKLESVKISKAF